MARARGTDGDDDLRKAVGVDELVRAARKARRHAHAPFSRFPVGAALRGGGRITTGANVESATYGLTLCAERAAVVKAVTEGVKRFDALAVLTAARTPTPPCGACRQVLWELCGDIWIHMETLTGKSRTVRLATLLPLPFDRRNL